ncbi:ADP-ribosylglycohydrolase family protein [Limosilactobacillus sp. STM2_1]|uniref:ADP-ribosylglycohydrolase family protein n=1 Tax=Limosilactobacillus rudii TaxID=2759755 RepID=A0A7W3UL80_9LACO|nr:ADP-ribosylglycohydrolase family protein [Limosilactobacillus rudii]MBB1078785.1 ADP-ribosylglycohydrolase family protein [Limosilactobacillus rudii]MBB1097663.1 ADP-ribosylglycohydrolase family protein [Limosilactobacillus rudii]MCD7134772.1 ADP-ribosylglycohydrolase family protein [Limosilactobacillus rudii]
MRDKDKILGALYGQAIGDAMGMPTELWPIQKIRAKFGKNITTFLDGTEDNDIAINFKAGEYTDDTNQAFAILDALIETNWQPDTKVIVKHIMKWADHVGAWTNNILGPSSKAALTLVKEGKDPAEVTKSALTNGCGMRISPIGTLYEPDQLDELVQMVYKVTKITHSSDVAISGAAMIAGAVTAASADYTWDDIVDYAKKANDAGFKLGAPTWAAHNKERLNVGLALAKKYAGDDEAFSRAIYETVGTGTMISESIPAAVAIAYYAKDVKKCAIICTNLGGDTDTIGAMATAICGAKNGANSIPADWKKLIDNKNPQHNIKEFADRIAKFNA